MRIATICLTFALGLPSAGALAQSPSDETDKLPAFGLLGASDATENLPAFGLPSAGTPVEVASEPSPSTPAEAASEPSAGTPTEVASEPSASTLAQGASEPAASDAVEKLRSCSRLAHAERLECLEKLSRDITPSPPATGNWIVSETTSPLDYTPVAIATASSSGGPDGATMKLSIQCRGGHTDLVIGGPALTRRGEDYVVSYGVNDGQPVVVAAGTPASGTGVAIRADVVRLLASLPDQGDIVFRVTVREGAALEGRYALAGLKIVRDRLAVPCKWPAAASAPRN